ncbi:MAG: hypothetical protein GKR90_22565 [Pseudomonadales bacterium]|nr:hypothetical protein [Pseudomonadales bacterium]
MVGLSFIAYIVITIAMTIWVARTLSTNGYVFLVEAFGARADLAQSINHMLVVGFYLINIGFVLVALRYGARPIDFPGAMEYVSTKVGLVMLVLGAVHFTLMYVIAKYGRHSARYIAKDGVFAR